jgi:hypothetical protein
MADSHVSQFIVHFHQSVQDNNLAEITLAYESGWNRLTEKYYAKTEWPEAELIAPLVNDGEPTQLLLQLHTKDINRSDLPCPISRAILPTCLLPSAT